MTWVQPSGALATLDVRSSISLPVLKCPPKLPESSATLPANPAKFRSYQVLEPSSVARDVKEPGQGEAAGLGRCHGFHVQLSGSLAWTWADGPAATRSIHGVPASSGGAIASSTVTSPPSPSDLGA